MELARPPERSHTLTKTQKAAARAAQGELSFWHSPFTPPIEEPLAVAARVELGISQHPPPASRPGSLGKERNAAEGAMAFTLGTLGTLSQQCLSPALISQARELRPAGTKGSVLGYAADWRVLEEAVDQPLDSDPWSWSHISFGLTDPEKQRRMKFPGAVLFATPIIQRLRQEDPK